MKKIMFNDKFGLTDDVLKGRKQMSRRIAYDGEIKDIHTGYITEGVDTGRLALYDGYMVVAKSKYKLGEVVTVAQSYKDLGYTKEWVEQHIKPNPNAKCADPFEKKYPGWNNKMFVSAAMCQHQIRITDIKAELLQAISNDDCMKEGLVKGLLTYGYHVCLRGMEVYSTPRDAFAALINGVSGKSLWKLNPYVFAYTFELVK